MNRTDKTQIQISISTRENLKKLRFVPRESYDDVIARIIKKVKG